VGPGIRLSRLRLLPEGDWKKCSRRRYRSAWVDESGVDKEIDTATGKRRARVLAEKVYALAEKGEAWAMQVVLDRTDGKTAIEATIAVQHQAQLIISIGQRKDVTAKHAISVSDI
jgi:hypothetical protein